MQMLAAPIGLFAPLQTAAGSRARIQIPSNSKLTRQRSLANSQRWIASCFLNGVPQLDSNKGYCSMPKERRRTPRHQLGRVAAILCGPGEERSCLVKDFSDGGVRLQLNGFEIPDDFALLFAPNELAQSGRYKVVWRLGNDVGAKFLGPMT